LDVSFLTPSVSLVLSGLFLDDEFVVREAMVTELIQFVVGIGVFGIEGSDMRPQPPPLRCFAFLALCTDGDHGVDHDPSNGSAASIGKLASKVSKSAMECCVNMRKVYEGMYVHIRSQERNVEKASARFEHKYKPQLLPEYVVPFVFFLLIHRPETPASSIVTESARSPSSIDGRSRNRNASMAGATECQHRTLRKRLKLIFDALVRSLGDEANNISFLLRMTEMLERNYRPIDATLFRISSTSNDASLASDGARTKGSSLLEAKLRVVCQVTRDILLSLVKKDVNLSHFPGNVLIPPIFVKKCNSTSKSPSATSSIPTEVPRYQRPRAVQKTDEDSDSSVSNLKSNMLSRINVDKSESSSFPDSGSSPRKVHFSPEIEIKLSARQHGLLTGDDGKAVSPIAKSESPFHVDSHFFDAADGRFSQESVLASEEFSSVVTTSTPSSRPSQVGKPSDYSKSSRGRSTPRMKDNPKASSTQQQAKVQITQKNTSASTTEREDEDSVVDPASGIASSILDDLDFDFHHPAVENNSPRHPNGASSERDGSAAKKFRSRKKADFYKETETTASAGSKSVPVRRAARR
jgi:hypothetical protein